MVYFVLLNKQTLAAQTLSSIAARYMHFMIIGILTSVNSALKTRPTSS